MRRGSGGVKPLATFWRRETVNALLRLGRRQSYRVFAPTQSGRISSARVVALLNSARRGIPAPIGEVPSDLVRMEEIAAETGATPRELKRWAAHKAHPIPHFRLNSHSLRFPRGMAMEWMGRARERHGGA